MREDFSGAFDLSRLVVDASPPPTECAGGGSDALTPYNPILGRRERLRLTAEWLASRGAQSTGKDLGATLAAAAAPAAAAPSAAAPSAATPTQGRAPPQCVWLPAQRDFCYRVAHETCIPLTHSFFLLGCPRLVTTLWRGPAFSRVDERLRDGTWLRGDSPLSAAASFRNVILDLRSQGVPLSTWAPVRMIGLP